jgi:hypothetical protein
MSVGTIPRIIDAQAARPWLTGGLSQSRAKWFATHDAMSRQALAYEALLLSGNQEAVQHAKSSIEEARRIRGVSSANGSLPVDDLLHRLDAARKRHIARAAPPAYNVI